MLSRSANARWYLIHCKPRENERALTHLERQGFQCYWPTRPVRRRAHERLSLGREALFPRYLFIHLDRVHDNWSSIRSTRGVSGIVRFATEPTPVPDEIIEGIRARLSGTSVHEPYLKPGERVCIAEGAFSQIEAIVVSTDGDERVVLLLNLLRRDQEISFPLQCVRKLA